MCMTRRGRVVDVAARSSEEYWMGSATRSMLSKQASVVLAIGFVSRAWEDRRFRLLLLSCSGSGLSRASVAQSSASRGSMKALSVGQLETTVLAINRRDEIGAMARAVQVFKDALIERRAVQNTQSVDEEARRICQQRLEQPACPLQQQVTQRLSHENSHTDD